LNFRASFARRIFGFDRKRKSPEGCLAIFAARPAHHNISFARINRW
jgi:hypothetical protein